MFGFGGSSKKKKKTAPSSSSGDDDDDAAAESKDDAKMLYSPFNSKLQLQTAIHNKNKYPRPPNGVCIVTGGTGFVGLRLVEMLIERGASKVISFDVVAPPFEKHWIHPKIEWRIGDITNKKEVEELIVNTPGVECVWHNAAAVGPFHPKDLYYKVNYQGTINIIDACKKANVNKIVMSSSPSTRFTGVDVDGLTEDELPSLPLEKYLQTYAETKAMGELICLNEGLSSSSKIKTVAIAPHQVYGPRDNLFLPNLLEAAGNDKLRIFGSGDNKICFTHVDNYCHGLILGEYVLDTSPETINGKFYIVTDGKTHPNGEQYLYFWQILNEAIVGMGFTSLYKKIKLPKWLLFGLAYICDFIGYLLKTTFKLSYFNVLVLTMHRWFDIKNAEDDLKFTPIIDFRQGWDETIEWFKENWLPTFNKSTSFVGISNKTQEKIDIQNKSAATTSTGDSSSVGISSNSKKTE